MGKRIISQARGKGSLSYQARKQAFIYRVGYPLENGSAQILKILHSAAHSAPLIKARLGKIIFYNVAFNGAMRDARSWRHFSIAKRVEFLQQLATQPEIDRNFQRVVLLLKVLVVVALAGGAWYVWHHSGDMAGGVLQ